MQYRILFPAFLLFAAFSTVNAQQQGPAPKIAVQETVKTDSVKAVVPKPSISLLAANIPSVNNNNSKYSHVPLAGEKSYFGDKNEWFWVGQYCSHFFCAL